MHTYTYKHACMHTYKHTYNIMVSARDVANNRGKRVLDMTPRSSIAQAGYRPD